MPINKPISFCDLQSEHLRLACSDCSRRFSYRVADLIATRGLEGDLDDFVDELRGYCQKGGECALRYPQHEASAQSQQPSTPMSFPI